MTRTEFLSKLVNELRSLNVDDTYIKTYIGHFQKQFDKIPNEALEKRLDSYSDVHKIALSIKESIDSKIKKADIQRSNIAQNDVTSYEEEPYEQASPDNTKMYTPQKFEFEPTYQKSDDHFMTKFVLLLPFIAILYVLVTALAISAEIVLAALIIIFGALCIVSSIGCIVLPIIGIYYGIILLSSSKYSGLYEIGLGIISLGACLGISVITYNLTIKFIPFLMRKCRELTALFYQTGSNIYRNNKKIR